MRYHAIVLGIYAVVISLVVFFAADTLRYGWPEEGATLALGIAVGSLIACVLFLRLRRYKKADTRPAHVGIAFLYAAAFAIPEEIIFRGLVQFFLQSTALGATTSIVLTSALFGAAHLLNGARGLHPSTWNWSYAGLAALAGIPLGTTFALTQSLLMPTILHMGFIMSLRLLGRAGLQRSVRGFNEGVERSFELVERVRLGTESKITHGRDRHHSR